MLVFELWSRIKGYVIIRAKGRRLEAFVNDAIKADIHLWRLERSAPHMLVARTKARCYARLARIGARVGVRVTVLQKIGLPFWLLKARRRTVFVTCGLLFALSLYVLAQFVWFVRVEGIRELTAQEVLSIAEQAGLRPGVPRHEVKQDDVVHRLHQKLPRLAWSGVALRGALATIRVVERTNLDPALDAPGHIVAAADGIVERLIVTRGTPVVDVGDTVAEGQLLISGMLTPESTSYVERLQAGEKPFIRAEGLVWGRVWYRGYAEVALIPSDDGTIDGERAKNDALAAAAAAIEERLPPGAEIKERDVSTVEDVAVQPAVVRATVTVAAYQSLGRFSPVDADSTADGVGQKDESNGQ